MRLRDLFTPKKFTPPKREAPPPPEVPLSLQLLFPKQTAFTTDALVAILRRQHPSLAEARAQIYSGDFGHGIFQRGRVYWGRHMVQFALFQVPMPAEHLEDSVTPCGYGEGLMAQVRSHGAHVGLAYMGEEKDPQEQYVALGMISVAMERLGAFLVVNASAANSIPMQPLVPRPGDDLDKVLRSLPWPSLFVGFVLMAAADDVGTWIRTCGAPLMGLPDLALLTHALDERKRTHQLFDTTLRAMHEHDVVFGEGDLLEEGERSWTLRKPRANERFLDSPRMLVLVPRKSGDPA